MIDSDREELLRLDVEALYFGYRAFTALPDRILAEQGLGRAHHRILYFVQRQPGISISELLTVLKISKQAMNGPLRELESLGLLRVAPDTADRRIRRVTTTTKGARLETQLTGAQTELIDAVFAELGPTVEEHWRAAMTLLAETDR